MSDIHSFGPNGKLPTACGKHNDPLGLNVAHHGDEHTVTCRWCLTHLEAEQKKTKTTEAKPTR